MSFSPRPSPFKRPDSPVTTRAASPQTSPTKDAGSPTQPSSPLLSPPERSLPFIRRPSQLESQRAKSPFARPPSRLNLADSSNDAPTAQASVKPEENHIPSTSTSLQPHELIIPTTPTSNRESTSLADPFTISSPIEPLQPQGRAWPSTQSTTSSTTITAPQTLSASQTKPPSRQQGYNHVPQALLHTMRESFEVLDSQGKGTVNASDISNMLEQLGLDNSQASLAQYFSQGQQNLNLARFLDGLTSGPFADLSAADELSAAFGAFDVDDSGQIDMAELREALIRTNTSGASTLKVGQVDTILDDFRGRRAFGAKGLLAKDLGSGARSDVFKYRDFMTAITGMGATTA